MIDNNFKFSKKLLNLKDLCPYISY